MLVESDIPITGPFTAATKILLCEYSCGADTEHSYTKASCKCSWAYCAADIGVDWSDGFSKEGPSRTKLGRVHGPLDTSPSVLHKGFYSQNIPTHMVPYI